MRAFASMIAIMFDELADRLRLLTSEPLEVGAGALVFRRDSPVDWLHFVDGGLVHLLRYKADGGVIVLQRAERGYFLAEASLFSTRYHCDAVAVSPARLTRFPKAAVLAALRGDPDLHGAWAQYLSSKVQRMRARAEMLSLRKLGDRLEAWLEWRDRQLPPKGEWVNIAREIGVSPEALYRHLATRRGAARDAASDAEPK